MSERQRLQLNLDSLFPGVPFEVGETTVTIRPLSIDQLALVTKQLKGFIQTLADDGVSWETFNTPENIFKIAVLLVSQFPGVLEEVTNIHIDDIKLLTIELVVKLIDKVVEVNVKSKEDLEVNFKSLVEKLTPLKNLTEKAKEEKQEKESPKKTKKVVKQ